MALTLKDLRKQAGFTQEKAAKKLGVSRVAISDWERGLYQPAPVRRPRLAALYKTTSEAVTAAIKGEA